VHHEANLSGFVAFGSIVSRPFPHHSSTAGGRFSSFLRTRGIFTRPSALYIGMSGAKIFLKQHETATGTCIGAVALTPVRACACIFLLFCMRVFSLPFLKQSQQSGPGASHSSRAPPWTSSLATACARSLWDKCVLLHSHFYLRRRRHHLFFSSSSPSPSSSSSSSS
jgi:hypothetical protein